MPPASRCSCLIFSSQQKRRSSVAAARLSPMLRAGQAVRMQKQSQLPTRRAKPDWSRPVGQSLMPVSLSWLLKCSTTIGHSHVVEKSEACTLQVEATDVEKQDLRRCCGGANDSQLLTANPNSASTYRQSSPENILPSSERPGNNIVLSPVQKHGWYRGRLNQPLFAEVALSCVSLAFRSVGPGGFVRMRLALHRGQP